GKAVVPGRKPVGQVLGLHALSQEREAGITPRDFPGASAARPPGRDRPGVVLLRYGQPLQPARVLGDVDPPADETFLGGKCRLLLLRSGAESEVRPECNNHDTEPHRRTSWRGILAFGTPVLELRPLTGAPSNVG